ncbi:MAG: MBL fold metallo-hydrolase [Candidatus Aminicenantes bacterium]|nr:MBL fold metallo-hydrolase [Candidatus Aminicenantes bacterium]
MKYQTVVVGPLETNCYLVYCEETKECAVVDPGAEPDRIFLEISELGVTPVAILNTHGHLDHIGANRDIKDHYGVPLWIHAADTFLLESEQNNELRFWLNAKDSPPADRFLEEGQIIPVGRSSLRVLHTPGHTPGSVCFLGEKFLLSGDTLFCEGVGRTDLPGGSARQLEESIRSKILTLPDELHVLPGHGPRTAIGRERTDNPFIA